MANRVQDKEVFKCLICGVKFDRSTAYQKKFRRTTCSGKCRLIQWAKNEEKKIQENKCCAEK